MSQEYRIEEYWKLRKVLPCFYVALFEKGNPRAETQGEELLKLEERYKQTLVALKKLEMMRKIVFIVTLIVVLVGFGMLVYGVDSYHPIDLKHGMCALVGGGILLLAIICMTFMDNVFTKLKNNVNFENLGWQLHNFAEKVHDIAECLGCELNYLISIEKLEEVAKLADNAVLKGVKQTWKLQQELWAINKEGTDPKIIAEAANAAVWSAQRSKKLFDRLKNYYHFLEPDREYQRYWNIARDTAPEAKK